MRETGQSTSARRTLRCISIEFELVKKTGESVAEPGNGDVMQTNTETGDTAGVLNNSSHQRRQRKKSHTHSEVDIAIAHGCCAKLSKEVFFGNSLASRFLNLTPHINFVRPRQSSNCHLSSFEHSNISGVEMCSFLVEHIVFHCITMPAKVLKVHGSMIPTGSCLEQQTRNTAVLSSRNVPRQSSDRDQP